MSVSLTVLIPTHGRPRLLERTLESVARCTLPDGYEELVVIENGSRAGAEGLVEDLPKRLNARYMHRERANKSFALNEALETIDDGLVVFFDDDIRVTPDVLVAYAEAGSHHGPGAFFGGPVDVDREADLPSQFAHLFPRSTMGYDLKESRMGNTYLGFNWAAFACDIKKLGGFDSRYGPGSPTGSTGQEDDMQGRMIEAGYSGVDVLDAEVRHYVPAENTTLRWLLKRRIRDGVREGIASDLTWWKFLLQMLWATAVSLGVFGKAVGTLDVRKMGFVLCNTFQRVGVLRGYLRGGLIEQI
jgi:glycosyltransferase involved in cell wall biosynthesis